jgi:hypothetical protein
MTRTVGADDFNRELHNCVQVLTGIQTCCVPLQTALRRRLCVLPCIMRMYEHAQRRACSDPTPLRSIGLTAPTDEYLSRCGYITSQQACTNTNV